MDYIEMFFTNRSEEMKTSSYTWIESEKSLSAFILQNGSKCFPDAHLLRKFFYLNMSYISGLHASKGAYS